jgi:hypothetical protein
MGQWINDQQMAELRDKATLDCPCGGLHDQISKTMPFCRNCGNPAPHTD